jgi:hypothetical protein
MLRFFTCMRCCQGAHGCMRRRRSYCASYCAGGCARRGSLNE